MATGTVTVDFGTGAQNVVTTVTGQTGIASNSHVEAWIMADTTADHTSDEHVIAAGACVFPCGNIVPGSASFDINAMADTELSGQFTLHYGWV